MAAGYFIAENFKAFNEPEKAKNAWIYTIIATIIIFGSILITPDNFPAPIIPLIYTAIAYYLVRHFQGQDIDSHLDLGGKLFSWGRTIVVGIIGTAITLIVIFGLVFLSDTVANNSVSTNTYGIMKHEIAYDKSNITEEEVNLIADGLIKTSFFDGAVTKYVFAKKVDTKYELSLSVVAGLEKDNKALQPFEDLRIDMQSLFPNNKIIFNLVVDNLDNVVKRFE